MRKHKNNFSVSETLLIKEVVESSRNMKKVCRDIPIGSMLKLIRTHLGMSQKVLSKLAGVPQSTVSRIEQGTRDANLSTLNKLFNAMSCNLVMAPMLQESIEIIRKKQARKVADKHVQYLLGTMSLEEQEPDPLFIKEMLKQEEERLLQGPDAKLWEG